MRHGKPEKRIIIILTPSPRVHATYVHNARPQKIYPLHLSKQPSDLKQNGTQEKTQFSGTVFNTLSHGVIRFVASVSSKNHLLGG